MTFAAINDYDQVSFHAFKRLLPSNQSLATTNHLIPDLTSSSNSLTEFDFCPGCDRDISITRDSRYTRCSDRFATNDIIPIPNSVTVWNRSSKHNVDSRSYANDSMENILQYLRRLHDLKGTYTPSDLIHIYFNDNSTRSRLLAILHQLRDSEQVNYTAYTDGSLQHLGSNDVTMTYGFILVDDASNEIRFKSSISHWPSSTRAEIMAVVTTLLVLPRNSHITIHTDSQATINGFHSHITTILTTTTFR
ncbi:ribonuclease H-like domain-containing protein [Rhizophagus clarus]|uniref:Ribonuclease H-like domain-containing protein n=1 Tax=Rhizophagus clarus TaxID=94130 RepID=A0A8H3QCD9_9GLOM|nr:ribonuclease H-like domain-containing protein [Rhizophagus clarus]